MPAGRGAVHHPGAEQLPDRVAAVAQVLYLRHLPAVGEVTGLLAPMLQPLLRDRRLHRHQHPEQCYLNARAAGHRR